VTVEKIDKHILWWACIKNWWIFPERNRNRSDAQESTLEILLAKSR